MTMPTARIAVIDPNTLATIGMKSILESIMPGAEIDIFSSFSELQANAPDSYFHFFAAMSAVLEGNDFFARNRRKTIVMTTSPSPAPALSHFHCLCVNQTEKELIRDILRLEQTGHHGGRSLPPQMTEAQPKILSDREIEVLALIAKGYLNKEIADKLNISLTTVVTHRHNITSKLQRKSVGALTIFAVMHGYVSVSDI